VALLNAMVELENADHRRAAMQYIQACDDLIAKILQVRNLSQLQGWDESFGTLAVSVGQRCNFIKTLHHEADWNRMLVKSHDFICEYYSALPGLPGPDPIKLPPPPAESG
jgi:hypothetical protein